MKFIFFAFAVFGLVEIIIFGKPTAFLRWLFSHSKTGSEFIRCPLCLGFWIGILVGYLIQPISFLDSWYLKIIIDGCMGSGIAYFLHKLINPIDFINERKEK